MQARTGLQVACGDRFDDLKKSAKTPAELQELRRMQEDLEAEIASMQDRIKAHMVASGVDSLTAGAFKVTWKEVTTTRVDAAALKKALPEVAARFSRTATVKRFTVQ